MGTSCAQLAGMSNSDFMLAAMTAAVVATAISFLVGDFSPLKRKLLHSIEYKGDRSLTPRSVNWLGAAALLGALVVVFMLS